MFWSHVPIFNFTWMYICAVFSIETFFFFFFKLQTTFLQGAEEAYISLAEVFSKPTHSQAQWREAAMDWTALWSKFCTNLPKFQDLV